MSEVWINAFTSSEQKHHIYSLPCFWKKATYERREQITGLLFHSCVYQRDLFLQPSLALTFVYIYKFPSAGPSLRDIHSSGAETTLPDFRSIFTPRQLPVEAETKPSIHKVKTDSVFFFFVSSRHCLNCPTFQLKCNESFVHVEI